MNGWTWTSPNGVEHWQPDTGPCATCGKRHEPGTCTYEAVFNDRSIPCVFRQAHDGTAFVPWPAR